MKIYYLESFDGSCNERRIMRILFFSPHPDDIEFAMASTEVQLVKKGHEVIEACFTADEYGTSDNEFKGERISRIRRWEMREAARVVGIHELYWLGYIDGYSRFDVGSVKKIRDFLLRINPDVIFAPDPIYSIDNHVDHINLGKTVCHVWARLKKKPPCLLYYTYRPNYYVKSKYCEQAKEAFKKHISQGFSNPLFLKASWLVRFIFGFFTPHAIFPETFRILGVEQMKGYQNPVRPPPLVKRFINWLFKNAALKFMPEEELYLPTPEELGLKEFRFKMHV